MFLRATVGRGPRPRAGTQQAAELMFRPRGPLPGFYPRESWRSGRCREARRFDAVRSAWAKATVITISPRSSRSYSARPRYGANSRRNNLYFRSTIRQNPGRYRLPMQRDGPLFTRFGKSISIRPDTAQRLQISRSAIGRAHHQLESTTPKRCASGTRWGPRAERRRRMGCGVAIRSRVCPLKGDQTPGASSRAPHRHKKSAWWAGTIKLDCTATADAISSGRERDSGDRLETGYGAQGQANWQIEATARG